MGGSVAVAFRIQFVEGEEVAVLLFVVFWADNQVVSPICS
ncbi:hypothetical protein CATRI_05970 [Corynebacterium atrinae]|nr:hypothetical protein CATRI_05970 [Corynebacterium atrinae]